MEIIPVKLVHPQPAKGLAWAMLIQKPNEVNLDGVKDVSRCSPMEVLSGRIFNPFEPINMLDGQFVVMGFQEQDLGPALHVLIRASPTTVLPAIIGDERRQVPFLDNNKYQPRLAAWRPGVQNLQKAAQSPVFAFALRIAFEFSEAAKTANEAPPTPPEDDQII